MSFPIWASNFLDSRLYRKNVLWMLAGLLSVAIAFPAFAVEAGFIKKLTGNVQIDRASKVIEAKIGDVVFGGDRIRVQEESSVGLSFKDETLVSLGPKSTFVIDDYRFDPTSRQGNVITSILKGTMRYVTGLIGKANPKAITVHTPTTTCGIRGTDFIVEVADGN